MKKQKLALFLIGLMFFNIGVMFCMNDVLLPVVKDYFKFSYVKATLIQVSFYIVYILWPIPITRAVEKFGYRTNIIACLILCMIGCLLFVPAYFLQSYILILLGVFTLSTGITIANVVANPYVTLLGDPSRSHMRLNLVQAASRIGYAVTPVAANALIFSSSSGNPSFHLPYAVLAVTLGLAALVLYLAKIPDIEITDAPVLSFSSILKESKKYPLLIFGVLTMFFYLGVEACTAGFFMSYFLSMGYEQSAAATFLSFYYILAAIFAIIGTLLLNRVHAGMLLAFFGACMILCLLSAIFLATPYSLYALTLAGGFLSVMFPTIFSLSIANLGAFTDKGSALLNFAIVGGAIFPPIQGAIADHSGVANSYVVPLVCAVVVTLFGWVAYRKEKHIPEASVSEM